MARVTKKPAARKAKKTGTVRKPVRAAAAVKKAAVKKAAKKSPARKIAAARKPVRAKAPSRKPAPSKRTTTKPAKGGKTAARGGKTVVLVATRKGGWIFHSDAGRKNWRTNGPHFLGHVINHMVLDPRDGRTLLAAAKTGHIGPTVFRSTDFGKNWKEAAKPPAFAKAPEGEKGRAVDHTFWLTPANAVEPNVWYAGTAPQGLFRTEDGGETWEPFSHINHDAKYLEYMDAQQDGTPDGPKMHSINIDPRDPKHIYFAMWSGGVHETTDGGKSWNVLIDGLEVVEGFDRTNITFHDPHCVRMSPSNPDRLYQQNHCGIYRLDRPGTTWERIGNNMPKAFGDIGFPMVVHPRNADICWVFPMYGGNVWPRISLGGIPGVFTTKNGGQSWQRLASGMPAKGAWWTVKRQAMTADAHDPVGLYFGTTSGEVWMSGDEGRKWSALAQHLPEIYAVETATSA